MAFHGEPFSWPANYETPMYKVRTIMENLDNELVTMFKTPPIVPPTRSSAKPLSDISTMLKMNSSLVKSRSRAEAEEDGKMFNLERYKDYKQKTNQAYHNRKIFTVHGNYGAVRYALKKRGWLEKLAPNTLRSIQSMTQHTLLKLAKEGNDYERVAISKMLERYPSYFIWQPKGMRDNHSYVLPFRNRVRRSRDMDFSTKLGLIGCTEQTHWNTLDSKAQVNCPRCYRLENKDEHPEFIRDFRLTQCLCLLNFIADRSDLNPMYDANGTIPTSVIHFAISQLKEDAEIRGGKDIDSEEETASDDQWESFISNSNSIMNGGALFKSENVEFLGIMASIKRAIFEAKKYWPMMHMDGYKNLWILKPGCMCRGQGITIMSKFDEIIGHANRKPKLRYIVQKYIERPLLIYNTKFDIRQYILLTITDSTVNIWMYKDCYLRFSSQQFSLTDFKESVHLTNNSIQKKYKNGARSDKLPRQNMWSLLEFENYLGKSGNGDVWSKIIYPGMKQIVIGIVLASLSETEVTPNAFEIYGCDFMLDTNFQPVLLEINATPDLSHSTLVTRRICPAAQEDLVKVVVDLPKNSRASTGNFELVHQIGCPKVASYVPGLLVNGLSMTIHPELPPKPTKKSALRTTSKRLFKIKSAPKVHVLDVELNQEESADSTTKRKIRKAKRLKGGFTISAEQPSISNPIHGDQENVTNKPQEVIKPHLDPTLRETIALRLARGKKMFYNIFHASARTPLDGIKIPKEAIGELVTPTDVIQVQPVVIKKPTVTFVEPKKTLTKPQVKRVSKVKRQQGKKKTGKPVVNPAVGTLQKMLALRVSQRIQQPQKAISKSVVLNPSKAAPTEISIQMLRSLR